MRQDGDAGRDATKRGLRESLTEAFATDIAADVDAKQAERTADALDRAVAADERDVVEAEPGRAPTMYLAGAQGGAGQSRRQAGRRLGADPGGQAGRGLGGRDRRRTAANCPNGEPGSVSYSAAVNSAAPATPNSRRSRCAPREARRRRFHLADSRVVLGDGVPWIWNLADELFHAKQHLWDVAKTIYGPGTDMAG